MTNYGKIRQAFIDLEIGRTFTRSELMAWAQVPTDMHTRRTASAIISSLVQQDLAIQDGKRNKRVVYKKLLNPKGKRY